MSSYYTNPDTGERYKIEKTHRFRNFVVFPILGLIALFVIVAAVSGGGSGPTGNGPAAPADASTGHTVRYEVTGDGQGMITFTTDANLSMSQATENLPWSTEVQFNESMFVPLSVDVFRSYQGGTGPIGCKILVDGKVVTENHSAGGEFANVMCNANL